MKFAKDDGKSKEVKGNKLVTLDDILMKFSLCGRYHVNLLFLIAFAFTANATYGFNYVFAVDKTGYRCKQSISLCNVSPTNGNEVDDFNPQCYQRVTQDQEVSCAYGNNSEVVPCTEWVYENPHSFVAEFQIACQEWKTALVGTAHCFGYMIGLPFMGSLSDSLGRKKVIIATGVLGAIIGVAKSLVYSYWIYIFFELCEAIIGDLCSASFMLMVEMVATKNRPMFVNLTHTGFTSGHVLAALAAWYLQYWRQFLQTVYAPSILFILYIYFLDESPRWLLNKGRKEEAVEILKKMAKTNKIELSNTDLDNLISEKKTDSNIGYITLLTSTLKSKIMLKRFLVCVVWWTSGTFISYGVAVNSVLLSGNRYINYMLVYIIDIPSLTVMAYVLKYYKRKIPMMISLLLASLFFAVHPLIPTEHPWLSLVVFISGKCMTSMFYGITYVFTSELFPTSTRNSMHALCSSIGRIGSIVAQQTPLLLVYWHGLPSTLMAAMALLASLVTIFVPDTADDDMPDNVREAEEIGKHRDITKTGI